MTSRGVHWAVLFGQTGIVEIHFILYEIVINVNKRNFEETFVLEQSLETGSTGFLLSGLARIALKVFFGLIGG